jgi:SAM-dependent methyltransferase
MDFRKTFDEIPETFDKYRPRYCDELFTEIITVSDLNSSKDVLEIGPGTGQATEPILKTGCNYKAIELGENFTEHMKNKYEIYSNFDIVNADFETYDFGNQTFDLIYSAATIQWIPEEIAFSKAYNILKPGGILAMFMTISDEKSANEELYNRINEVYKEHFSVKQRYNCNMKYANVVNYGLVNYKYQDWKKVRTLNADEYISYISTHCEHITLEEPYKSKFYTGVRKAIIDAGNKIIINDTIPLYLAQKPL